MKFDIIIQAGQSNAEGCGLGEVEREYIPTDKVWLLNAPKRVTALPERMDIVYLDEPLALEIADEEVGENGKIGNFGLTFSEAYIKAGMLEEGRAVLIIRAGIGGTGFWRKEWGVGNMLYNKLIELVDYALSLDKENRVVGLLWHQGEHDAVVKNPPEQFGASLKEQMLSLRARYGNMPIVAGDFVNDWKSKNLALCEPIIQTIKKVLEECGRSAFVETADLLSNDQKTGNGDDIHFCRESQHILGERFFEAFKNL